MLDLAQAELDVADLDLLGVHASPFDHRGRHVDADHVAGRSNLARGEEAVDARAGAEIEHRLAGQNRGEGDRVAASEAEIRAFGNVRGIRLGVAIGKHGGDRVDRARAAAGDLGSSLSDGAVALAHDHPHIAGGVDRRARFTRGVTFALRASTAAGRSGGLGRAAARLGGLRGRRTTRRRLDDR